MTGFWKALNEGGCIYCAGSLFSPGERVWMATLAGALQQALSDAAPPGLGVPPDAVFLPFRDSKQSTLLGPARSQRIFQLDIEQLVRAVGIVARVEGLSVDSGVAMEVGRAFGRRIPIALLKLGFMGEAWVRHPSVINYFDPVLATMADLQEHHESAISVPLSYLQSQLQQELYGISRFAARSVECFCARQERQPAVEVAELGNVFIDVMGGRYAWAAAEQGRLEEELRQRGWAVYVAQRYRLPGCSGARSDIEAAARCEVGIFSGDGPELDAGSAALFGYLHSLKRQIVFEYTSPVLYAGASGQIMRVNLMIEQAASYVTDSRESTLSLFPARHA